MEKAIKNITSERIVIGILLNHPEWLLQINNLKSDYFFLLAHKTIHYIIQSLLREGFDYDKIDSMAILARAEKIARASEVLQENGGLEYLEEIKMLSENYGINDLKIYANEVITCAYKREQLRVIEYTKNMIEENNNLTIEDINFKIQTTQEDLLNKYINNTQIHIIKDIFDDTWKEIENNRNGTIVGLPSKIPIINDYFTYMNGELVIIGARPKYGKSNFGINEAHYLAVMNNIPVAIFDTEMKTRTFLSRIISLDSGVPVKEIMTGSYINDVDKVMAVETSKERIKKAPLFHKYDPFWDRGKIMNTAKLLKLKNNLGMLIYDYIKVKEVTGNQKEHNELGNWTIFLKDLAGELDIPVLTFAQLSPHEIRLADSDKINRYASTIAYLLPKTNEQIQRDFGAENGGRDMLFVEYNRNGDFMVDISKGINLIYDRKTIRFEQAPYQILKDDYQ